MSTQYTHTISMSRDGIRAEETKKCPLQSRLLKLLRKHDSTATVKHEYGMQMYAGACLELYVTANTTLDRNQIAAILADVSPRNHLYPVRCY